MIGSLITAGVRRAQRTPQPARRFAVGAYVALILFLSLLPGRVLAQVPIRMLFFDKLVHFAMYGGLAVLLFWSEWQARRLPERIVMIFFLCSAYGVLIEILQKSFPSLGRSFSTADILANATGAAVSLAILVWRSRMQQAFLPAGTDVPSKG
jgi:VanZ family protein